MFYLSGMRALKVGVIALGLTSVSSTALVISADAAYAEKGGNGNGNGRGNSNRSERANNNDRSGNGNGRGAIARELRGLNASNANQRALENASPNSMPGKLYVYQQARTEFIETVDEQNAAYDEYQRLTNLTEDEIAAEFPDGGYEDAVTEAAIQYDDLRNEALEAQSANDASLAILTEGRKLSSEALAELHRRLGF